ncbi:MAG TPA: aminotransferase [Alphaproteobacteria bacterium]|nr:aminotransferase [Alphaproteobacteria bacterium]
MKTGNTVLSRYGATIFATMSRLAQEKKALNLGQGIPEDGEPRDIIDFAADALKTRSNQYPPMYGLPELRQAIARHDREFYGLELDWQTETIVLSGGTEALGVSLLSLIDPGDEVVLIEPLYDTYLPVIQMAGGIARIVRLEPPEWTLPEAELAAAFGPKTKLILFNTPMNPTAKVFNRRELDFIADLCRKHDAYAVCDEVYEHLVFDGAEHVPLITLPGIRDRTIRIQSAGKTFSLTGWKVGYISACAALIDRIVKAHQFLVFTTPPNLQAAIAYGLNKERAFFTDFTARLQAKRDRFVVGLERAGFAVAPCAGTYFVNVDIGSVGFDGDDAAFCRDIIETAGVAAIPVSAFYADAPETRFVRFCFAKPEDILDDAAERLKKRFA